MVQIYCFSEKYRLHEVVSCNNTADSNFKVMQRNFKTCPVIFRTSVSVILALYIHI